MQLRIRCIINSVAFSLLQFYLEFLCYPRNLFYISSLSLSFSLTLTWSLVCRHSTVKVNKTINLTKIPYLYIQTLSISLARHYHLCSYIYHTNQPTPLNLNRKREDCLTLTNFIWKKITQTMNKNKRNSNLFMSCIK